MRTYLAVLILSALASYFLTPLARWLAVRWGAMDLPDERKIHARPMPRLGGFFSLEQSPFTILLVSGLVLLLAVFTVRAWLRR